jgi:hypothetical protein
MTPRDEYIAERTAIILEGNTVRDGDDLDPDTGTWKQLLTEAQAAWVAEIEAKGKEW